MLKFITNIQISRRLLLAFLFAAVIPGIVISLLGFTFIREQNVRSQAVQININASKSTSVVNSHLLRMHILLNTVYQKQYENNQNVTSAQTRESVSQLQDEENSFGAAIQHFQQDYQINNAPAMRDVRTILISKDSNTQLPGQQHDALSQVNTLWLAYKSSQDYAQDAIIKKVPGEQANVLLIKANNDYMQLEVAWGKITNITDEISYKVAEIGPTQTNPFAFATLIAFLSTVLVVTIIGYVVYRTITQPLHQLAILTRRIAKGETDARAQIVGNDEISLVAASMNTMLDNIVSLIQEAHSQRDVLKGQIEKLLSEVSGIGEGDLRVQADVTTDALGVLADSFNYMIEELGSLVVRAKNVAGEVGSSTNIVLKRMAQLVDAGNKQIEQIGRAKTEIDRVTASSRQVAERANNLYDVARVARQDAHVGRESIEQATAGIGRINLNVQATALKVQTLDERSREINEIVEAISSIAHQTNRLALDAAIQAAMAGENGKGFGAVAADIRRLAERAKDQASMINHIVRDVHDDISAVASSMQDTERETAIGTQLTLETGIALEAIFAAVEHQAREIENINQVAKQQLKSSSTVVNIMKEVAESTQRSSHNTQEAAQYMERLGQLVEQLQASVAAFKLRENLSYYVPHTNSSFEMDQIVDGPLTVSGVFRTMNANLLPVKAPVGWQNHFDTFTPSLGNDAFALTPMPNAPQAPRQHDKSGSGSKWNDLPQSDFQSHQE